MSYEITGTLLQIEAEQTFASGFSKREFVITTDGKYPQCVKLELTKEKCAQLDQFREGDPVKVHFNVRGNEFQGRYYVNLQAWKLEADGAANTSPQSGYRQPSPPQARQSRPYPAQPPRAPQPAAVRQDAFYEEESDDIPF